MRYDPGMGFGPKKGRNEKVDYALFAYMSP